MSAQYFMNRNSWKKQRHEIFLGFGVGNFLGDLGGRDEIGKDYSYADLEMSLTRPSATFGYRFRIAKNFGFRTDFNYMRLWGKDALTAEKYRNNRNLSFRTNIFEFSGNLEFAIALEKGGNRYHFKHTFKRRQKQRSQYIYIFAGIGGFWYNPKAQYGGNWYSLHSMSTEGQGLPGGPAKYKRISASIPLGIGYRAALGQHWTVGIEYNFRKTFTDYIDDVHGVYYDNATIYQEKGAIAAYFADPSKGDIPTATMPNADGSGAQRGDNELDSYLSLELKVGYAFMKKKKKKGTRAKF